MTAPATYQVIRSRSYAQGIGGLSFSFAVGNFDPPGCAPDFLEEVQEELTDLGVNGRRWRRINTQFTPFQFSTVADAGSYDACKRLVNNYRQANGTIGNLTASLDGAAYTWGNVKVTAVKPSLRKGVLTGDGATTGSAGVVFCQWSMVLV